MKRLQVNWLLLPSHMSHEVNQIHRIIQSYQFPPSP